ncbi:hypothetical protein AB4851_26580 [Burkholderia sp. 22PA0099]|uniref:hypothetical protein n=1 Tax=unclassified Burkholderia TaxID=2613784 RepID=UPI00197CDE20|nr:hypothetical protein [Burkholderia sp. Ac-20379]MBN3725795.1 hypothetical protein [Burkholderia sp. Ac-20379]
MQTPALRHWILIGTLATAAMLGACNDDGTATPVNTSTAPKAACGNAAPANATLHCPPGFTAPKS